LADLTLKISWEGFRDWAKVQTQACFCGQKVGELTEPVMIRAPFAHDPNVCLEAKHANIKLRLDDEETQEAPGMLADITHQSVRYSKSSNISHRRQVPMQKPHGTPHVKQFQHVFTIREMMRLANSSKNWNELILFRTSLKPIDLMIFLCF